MHLITRDHLIDIFSDVLHFIDFVLELITVVDEDDITRKQFPINIDLARLLLSDGSSDLFGFFIIGDEFVPGFFIDCDILLIEIIFVVDNDVKILVLWEFFRDLKELSVVGDEI